MYRRFYYCLRLPLIMIFPCSSPSMSRWEVQKLIKKPYRPVSLGQTMLCTPHTLMAVQIADDVECNKRGNLTDSSFKNTIT
jgi:hypothetical protein